MRCVQQHASDRDLEAGDAQYWVAAFAVNQNSGELLHIFSDFPQDYAESPFGRALGASKGVRPLAHALYRG